MKNKSFVMIVLMDVCVSVDIQGYQPPIVEDGWKDFNFFTPHYYYSTSQSLSFFLGHPPQNLRREA